MLFSNWSACCMTLDAMRFWLNTPFWPVINGTSVARIRPQPVAPVLDDAFIWSVTNLKFRAFSCVSASSKSAACVGNRLRMSPVVPVVFGPARYLILAIAVSAFCAASLKYWRVCMALAVFSASALALSARVCRAAWALTPVSTVSARFWPAPANSLAVSAAVLRSLTEGTPPT